MKKGIIIIVAAAVLLVACNGEYSDYIQSQLNEEQQESINKAAQEMKDALLAQMKDFFASTDFEESIGLTSQEQSQLETTIQECLDRYKLDSEQLETAQEDVKKLLENAEGVSVSGLQEKINEIFAKQETE